jgi:hypothetical protein
MPKERKKFWDMGWAGKRDKDKPKHRDEVRPSEDGRRSVDIWNRESAAPSHVEEERREYDQERGRMLGVDLGQKDAAAARDVQSAIREFPPTDRSDATEILCAHPDPSFSATYEVCDRINHSESPDTVAKEAARAIRKQFKHGNEAERKNAARVWLFMMKNIRATGFKGGFKY